MALKQPALEFSRPFEVARLPNSGSHEKLLATATECETLAKRMQVPAIHALSAKLLVKPWRGGGVKVTGDLLADVEHVSVVSLEAFTQRYDLPVERYFAPESHATSDEDDDLIDVIEGGSLDLGELLAETLALELDQYPRKPGETFASGDEPEPEKAPNPFSGLATIAGGKPGK
jgi:uncharacterized metal-binding protein YceD (DUF177 family)